VRPIYFVVPGPLNTPTGGFIYDRRIVEGLCASGWPVEVRELAGAFPRPDDDERAAAATMFATLPEQSIVIVDGLVYGPLVEIVEREASRLRFVAVVHLPLAADPSLSSDARASLERDEIRALRRALRIVVTGRESFRILRERGISDSLLSVAEPGTDAAALATGSREPRMHVVCVATVNAIKGHSLLIRSLARLRNMNWRLSCAGSTRRDAETAAAVRNLIREMELEDRVALLGELPALELQQLLDTADVFALATRFETFGMAVAEAVARGLPVVSTRTGSIPEIVGDDAGLLVPPDDEESLTEALRCLIGDATVRSRLRAGALRARDRLEPWSSTIVKFTALLSELRD